MLTMLQILHLNPTLAAVEQDRLLALLNETSGLLPGVRSAKAGKEKINLFLINQANIKCFQLRQTIVGSSTRSRAGR